MKANNKHLLLQLFWTFMKISPVTFGGGFVMMPLMKKEVVDKKKWIQDKEIIDSFALAQSAPGSVAVNSAAFVGYRISGVKGALAATIGMMIPTFLIVIILSLLFLTVRNSDYVEAAFKGIRPAVVALIVYAAITTVRSSIPDKSTLALMIIAVILLIFFHMHPVLLIAVGILSGIAIKKMKPSKKERSACRRKVEEGR
ncbi:chromate transporter [Siminovitchia terrae]|uniref:Chromate transporter n=1 Tax=Siminovitchia terrae TaxID=1914933 RepID=A0A429X2B1_SIMTE|nr:chromate transporter [Siminovitchia terrae]RST57523.1 chromate transporter [Siminovitchia terrae]GIN90486.1 chromate transporter [Siminovitchia terrae]GIN97094.1 chromate transporter [Siminovitchia terrae]